MSIINLVEIRKTTNGNWRIAINGHVHPQLAGFINIQEGFKLVKYFLQDTACRFDIAPENYDEFKIGVTPDQFFDSLEGLSPFQESYKPTPEQEKTISTLINNLLDADHNRPIDPKVDQMTKLPVTYGLLRALVIAGMEMGFKNNKA